MSQGNIKPILCKQSRPLHDYDQMKRVADICCQYYSKEPQQLPTQRIYYMKQSEFHKLGPSEQKRLVASYNVVLKNFSKEGSNKTHTEVLESLQVPLEMKHQVLGECCAV
jgi:hypothetical protein